MKALGNEIKCFRTKHIILLFHVGTIKVQTMIFATHIKLYTLYVYNVHTVNV
jgi:hypothetical protein